MARKSKAKFKMKGHTLPGINQKSETVNLKDGKSPSSAFQQKSIEEKVEDAVIDGVIISGGTNEQKSKDRKKELSILDKLRAARTAVSTSDGPFGDSNFMDRYRDEKKNIRRGEYTGDSFKTG